MRDLTERRRIQPRRDQPTVVGIPDDKVVPITSMSQLATEQTDGRPILARADDGSLHTVPRERPPRGDC